AELSSLEAQRGALALAVTLGEKDAKEQMDAYRAKVETARARVSDLRAAQAAARERDAQADQERIAKARAGQVASLKQRLTARDDLVRKVAIDIANAVMHWRDLIDASANVKDLLAELGVQAPGALLEVGELRVAVQGEIFRVGSGEAGFNG